MKVLEKLVTMSRELARPEHGQVILGEGNTSANSGANFWIKGSGNQLATVDESGFVEVDRLKVLQALDESGQSDDDLRQYLNSCRTNARATVFPSTETYMHAWLLDQPGVDFVGHTHPVNVLGIMCGPHPAKFATERYFPDQIVLCGPKSLLVPYVAPGLALAKAIRSGWKDFVSATGSTPKSILMINHGLICVGATPSEVVAGCLMMEKAAKVFLAAGDPKPLTPEQVQHIHTWTDEHYRQSKLWEDQS